MAGKGEEKEEEKKGEREEMKDRNCSISMWVANKTVLSLRSIPARIRGKSLIIKCYTNANFTL